MFSEEQARERAAILRQSSEYSMRWHSPRIFRHWDGNPSKIRWQRLWWLPLPDRSTVSTRPCHNGDWPSLLLFFEPEGAQPPEEVAVQQNIEDNILTARILLYCSRICKTVPICMLLLQQQQNTTILHLLRRCPNSWRSGGQAAVNGTMSV